MKTHQRKRPVLDIIEFAERLAADILVLARSLRGYRSEVDQLKRSSLSVASNLAEGFGRRGGDKAYHYNVAYSSALEASTQLRVLALAGAVEMGRALDLLERLDKVQATAYRLEMRARR